MGITIITRRFLITCLYILFLFNISAAEAHTLFCKDWLLGTYVGDISNDNTTSSNKRDTSKDAGSNALVVGQCKDYFPSWGERMKIERIGNDPFDAKYRVTRQYCWARNILFSNQCGSPKIHWCAIIPCRFTWNPPASTNWGDTRSAEFSDAEVMTNVIKSIFGGLNKASLAKTAPNGTFQHGGVNDTKRTKICAYFRTNFIGSIVKKDSSLIGCVDAPFKPTPPVFNAVVPPTSEPFIDIPSSASAADTLAFKNDLIKIGSRFDQPLVTMSFLDPITNIDMTLYLRYRYDGDTLIYDGKNGITPIGNANALQCDKFANHPVTFCAKIPDNAPNQVCVCEHDQCDQDTFLGCVPRPTPVDSNIAIIGSYQIDTDPSAAQFPAIELIFAHSDSSGQPIVIDQEGNEIYLGSDKNYYKKDNSGNNTGTLAKQPFQYKRLPLPASPILIREYYQSIAGQKSDGSLYYNLTHGAGEAYGLQFSSMIPRLDATSKNPIFFNIRTAKTRDCDSSGDGTNSGCLTDGCIVTARELDSTLPQYYSPSGKRIRDLCCDSTLPVATQIQQCEVPTYQPTCLGSQYSIPAMKDNGIAAPAQDTLAEEAVCPGAYDGPLFKTDGSLVEPTIDHICLTYQGDWAESFVKPYCVPMPMPCAEITIPTVQSGFATWDATNASNAAQTGVCDIGYGFEKKKNVNITLKSAVSSLNDSDPSKVDALVEFAKIKNELTSLQKKADAENRNVQLAEFSSTQYVEIAFTEIAPTRQCLANIYATTVQNQCVKANGCIAITKGAPINGNILIIDASNQYQATATTTASTTNAGSISAPVSINLQILGGCAAPYVAAQNDKGTALPPLRTCTTDYYTSGGNVYMTKQIWSNDIANNCILP